MRAYVLRVVPLMLVLGVAATAPADEIRLRDGEVLFGTVVKQEKGRLRLRTASGVRTLKVTDVAERLTAPDPSAALAERTALLDADDAEGRAQLAVFAWRHRLDEKAQSLAEEACRLSGMCETAHRFLGHVRGESSWTQGWTPGWGAQGRTGPRWGRAKRAALAKGGGTAKTEAAALTGLHWLARHQDEDGKLDADGFQRHDPPDDPCDGQGGGHHGERVPCAFDGATTAVALMAWLASGSTPISGPFRENVKQALAWCRARIRSGPAGAYGLWNHGFCTQAVADAYAVTRDPALRADLEAAVDGLLRHQRSDGGWSYYMGIGDVPTTGVAGSALALATQAGIGVPVERVGRVLAFLEERVHGGSGRSEYHDGAERKRYTPTRANTAAGLTVRALFGRLKEAPHLGKQVGALGGRKPVWKLEFKEVKTKDGRKVRAQIGNLYPYLWYYTTMALFARGGGSWSKWFGGLKTALLAGQRKRGSCAGSWDPLGTYSSSAGRAFITGLCVLMLQAPYRYPR